MAEPTNKPSLRMLIDGYRRTKRDEELRTEWAVTLIYRPASLPLTWLLARLGASPNTVTLSGLVVVMGMPLCAVLLPADPAIVAVCFLAILFCVIDCTDGALARATGRVSTFGHYLDFASDVVYRMALYASLGILADRLTLPADDLGSQWLIMAIVAAWLALFARLCRVYTADRADTPDVARHDVPASSSRLTPMQRLVAFVSGTDHTLPFIALALWALGSPHWAVIWLAAYSVIDLVYTQIAVIRAHQR